MLQETESTAKKMKRKLMHLHDSSRIKVNLGLLCCGQKYYTCPNSTSRVWASVIFAKYFSKLIKLSLIYKNNKLSQVIFKKLQTFLLRFVFNNLLTP